MERMLALGAALAWLGCAQTSAPVGPPDTAPTSSPAAERTFPLTDAQREARVVAPEVGDTVRPDENGWFACASQRLVLAAWFAQLARHPGATRALFANEGERVDCVWLRPDDPSVESIRVLAATDDRFGEARIRHLRVRIRFAEDAERGARAVEMFSLGGVAGGFQVVR